MTFTSKAQTWDQTQLNNNLGHTGMIELSETDLDEVSGGTLGLLLYAKISLVKKVFSLFGKSHGSYGHNGHNDHHDDCEDYGKKPSYGKKY